MNDSRQVTLQMVLFISFLAFITRAWLLVVAVFVLCLVALTLPLWSAKIEKGWLSGLDRIGRINRTVLITVFYCVFIVPYGVFYRLTKKTNAAVFTKRSTTTYYKNPEQQITHGHFEKMW